MSVLQWEGKFGPAFVATCVSAVLYLGGTFFIVNEIREEQKNQKIQIDLLVRANERTETSIRFMLTTIDRMERRTN